MTREEFLNSENTEYSDWFGKGCLKQDLYDAERSEGEEASKVLRSGFMLLVFFSKSYCCIGYDSNEYCHNFIFESPTNTL